MAKEKGNLLDSAKKLGINLMLDGDSEDESNTEKASTTTQKSAPATKEEESVSVKQKPVSEKALPKKTATKKSTNDLFSALTDDDDNNSALATIKLKITDLSDQTTQILKLTGVLNSKANVKVHLLKWLNNGYVLAHENQELDNIKFDEQNKEIEIELKHKQVPTTRKKVVKETVIYSAIDDEIMIPSKVETLTFIQKGTKDLVNDTVSWDNQVLSKSFPKIISPKIQGYTQNIEEIKETPVNIDTSTWNDNFDIKHVVNYSPDEQNIIIKYVDQTDNSSMSKKLTGHTNEVAHYSTDKIINAFIKHGGFRLVKDETKGKVLKYNDQTGKDQVFHVYFAHILEKISFANPTPASSDTSYKDELHKDITRTIYIDFGKNNNEERAKKYPPIVQRVMFTRNGEYDVATGDVTFDQWRPDEKILPAYPALQISGYETDSPAIPSKTVTKDTEPLKAKLKYTPQEKTITIKMIDKTSHRELASKQFTGHSDEKLIYDWERNAETLRNAGYDITDKSFEPVKNVYYDPKQTGQTIRLIFTHKIEKVDINNPTNPKTGEDLSNDLSKTVTRTIQYILPDTIIDFPEDTEKVQAVTFIRSAKIDMALGTIDYGEWSYAQSFDQVKVPQIQGYTPRLANANHKVIQVVLNKEVTAHASNSVVKVRYEANPQKIRLNVFDQKINKPIAQKTLQGKSNEPISLSSHKLEKIYIDKGYSIIDDEFSNVSIFKPTDKLQEYTLTVDHAYHELTLDEPKNPVTKEDLTEKLKATRKFIVQYCDKNDNQIKPSNTQEMHLNRTATVDMTDGTVKYGDWMVENELSDVITPNIDGYVADKDIVNAPSNLAKKDEDVIEEVKYYIQKQQITLSFIDQRDKTIASEKIDIDIDQSNSVPMQHFLDEIIKAGYGINVGQNYPDVISYDKTKADHREYVIKVHETFLTNHDNKDITRIVRVHGPNGFIEENRQIAHLTRTITISNVTGKKTISPWTKGKYSSIVLPKIDGYIPDTNMIPPVAVTVDSKSDAVDIRYHKEHKVEVKKAKPEEIFIKPTRKEHIDIDDLAYDKEEKIKKETESFHSVKRPIKSHTLTVQKNEEKPKKLGFWAKLRLSFKGHKKQNNDDAKGLPEPERDESDQN